MPPRVLPALPLCLLLMLAACAPLPPADGPLGRWESAQLAQREARLRDSPQRIRDPSLETWLGELLRRIDPVHGDEVRLYLLDLDSPQADLVGERLLRIRLGLLLALRNEAELVFVLAHELAHRELGHVAARRRAGWDAQIAERQADHATIAALHRLGYAPDAGVSFLSRMRALATQADDTLVLDARIVALSNTSLPSESASPHVADDRFERLLAPHRARAGNR